MRIAFVTSCLEPEGDGVGDYTTLLAAECEHRGHAVARLALDDARTAEAVESPGLLRLPQALPWSARVAHAWRWVEAFAPDAVSLQFVCYGFHPRGFCGRAVDSLRRILGPRPVQIMLHELWVGAEQGAGFKDRLIGAVQRRGVLRLFSVLNVHSVSTSNHVYAALLGARGVAAKVLPLFGNVPASTLPPRSERPPPWRFLIFGTLHREWRPEPLLTLLRALEVPVEIIHAGRIGSGAALWERMRRDHAAAFTFRQLGELPPEALADLFSEVDVGIATTPWEIIGKSGSVAALLEHGLPVVVNRDDVHYPGFANAAPAHPLLLRMTDDLPRQLRAARRQPVKLRLPEIAGQFLAAWEGAAPRQVAP